MLREEVVGGGFHERLRVEGDGGGMARQSVQQPVVRLDDEWDVALDDVAQLHHRREAEQDAAVDPVVPRLAEAFRRQPFIGAHELDFPDSAFAAVVQHSGELFLSGKGGHVHHDDDAMLMWGNPWHMTYWLFALKRLFPKRSFQNGVKYSTYGCWK